ncbi:MAG: hypothetical protein M3Z02_11375 [Actinomycetota bacterium]|nr:hypothetical protein [Actinomycetota bacterium]
MTEWPGLLGVLLRGSVAGLLAIPLGLAAAGPAGADPGSLYTGGGPRPGPDILYEPPAVAPQLTNDPAGIWHAAPILVSGTTAYRAGEFLYQDFLYDDHGARTSGRDPGDRRSGGDTFSQPNGYYTYPTDPAYAGNAADLVELRVTALPGATALRVTLNTLVDPAKVAFSIGLGTPASAAAAFPHGANVSTRADRFLTVHGSSAELADALGAVQTPAPTVSVDLVRRQFDVRIPHGAYDPGVSTVRLTAGVGLWDAATGRYLLPQPAADAAHPGGSGTPPQPAPAAFFNVAFRTAEPPPLASDPDNAVDPAWWRDRQQGTALAAGDISALHADVSFATLAAGTTDEGGVPTSGPMDRILASHFETTQGTDYSVTCGRAASCRGELRGRLQPYAIYVPTKPGTAAGYGLTLLLHSLAANYNQYLSSRNQSQFGERGPGSIVITPSGRGPDSWYYDYGGADTFEVWADVAARYRLDPAYTSVAGYSMGGYGTYKFATQYPDLFAKGQPTVGPPGLGVWLGDPSVPPSGGDGSLTFKQLASLRNIPFLMWVEATDELVPFPGTQRQARGFDDLGYRYEFDTYTVGDHLTLAVNDQFQPAADFLGPATVDRNPPHVTYVRNPSMDFPGVGTTADHAYWLSSVALRVGGGTALGTVDVRSGGFGVGDAPALPTAAGGGVLTGGTLPGIPFVSQAKAWGAAPSAPVANRLDVSATNVRTVTVDVVRARVGCDAAVAATSDGPLDVVLTGPGCSRTVVVNATGPAAAGNSQTTGSGSALAATGSGAALPALGLAAVLAAVLTRVGLRRRRPSGGLRSGR